MNLDDIEQHAPKGPNVKLIFTLFCVTLLVFFGIALIFLHFEGRHIHFHRNNPNPNASLTLPAEQRATLPLSS